MKKLLSIESGAPRHWVGNGFPVRTLFSHQTHGQQVSPFLLLDYAGPAEFAPSGERRGVDEHPHRGFETVTIVYQGELEHLDSAGNHGRIGPGDVQWMTAASGIVHEEWHEQAFTRNGGVLEMVQLWVNLPAKEKRLPPRYQEILAKQIPSIAVGEGASARLIAGKFQGLRGPAMTFTPMTVMDVSIPANSHVDLPIQDGHTALAIVRRGQVRFDNAQTAGAASLAVFDREGSGIAIDASDAAAVLILSGEPIDEPVVSYGPFVMNTQEEIRQAIDDYRAGRLGRQATM